MVMPFHRAPAGRGRLRSQVGRAEDPDGNADLRERRAGVLRAVRNLDVKTRAVDGDGDGVDVARVRGVDESLRRGIEREAAYVRLAEERLARVRAAEAEVIAVSRPRRAEPRVPFGWLVERGLLAPGTVLVGPGGEHAAKVRADGTLVCAEATGSIHQIAARVQGLDPITYYSNGTHQWGYWADMVRNAHSRGFFR